MKIVHIITRLIIGGAQENTLLSCQGQHDLGHDVTLLTGPSLGPEGSLMPRATSYGYHVETLDSLRRSIHPAHDWRAYRDLTRRLRELKPDIVHTHSSKAGIIGRYAAHRAQVPGIVHTIHGLAFTASTNPAINWFYKKLEQSAAPITHRIACVATEMSRQSLAAHIGRPEQYVTVYSGMNTSAYLAASPRRDAVRASLGLEPHHVAVATISRLFHLKGHDDILSLAPKLCAQFPSLRFLWIGDGLLRQQFEQKMSALNLRDRFILTGLVPPDQIPELSSAIDILLHPSRREGLARAIVQGQLASAPAICYDIDGNREGLLESQTGFAIPPFNLSALEQKLSLLLSTPTLRQKMGAAGQQFALSRFDTQVMVNSLEKVYASALNQAQGFSPGSSRL
jgi:glycosyltransferase involved in cell wall biosynthesis